MTDTVTNWQEVVQQQQQSLDHASRIFLLAVLLLLGVFYLYTRKFPFHEKLKKYQDSSTALMIIAFIIYLVLGVLHITAIPVFSFSVLGFGLLILTAAFRKLHHWYPATWLQFFYYIGVGLTVIMTFAVSATSHPDIEFYFILFVCELVGLTFVSFLALIGKALSSKTYSMPTSTSDKYAHYRAAGMNDQEIEFLRAQLATAKEQIQRIEQNFGTNAKLRTTEIRYNTVKISQNYFKDIVQNPTRLVEASDFLYKLLPSLDDILTKYNEVNAHVAKNKQTYLILEKSMTIIEQLCQSISDSYVHFHRQDFADLEDELYVAERSMQKQNATSTDENVDSVDAIVQLGKDELNDSTNTF